ncbi:Isoamylase 3, chloroplastic-like protein [Drosera capensis]
MPLVGWIRIYEAATSGFHDKNGGDIYLAFNAHDYFVKAALPSPPRDRRGHKPQFAGGGVPYTQSTYNVAPFSSILMEAKL